MVVYPINVLFSHGFTIGLKRGSEAECNSSSSKVKISPKEEAAFYATRYTRN